MANIRVFLPKTKEKPEHRLPKRPMAITNLLSFVVLWERVFNTGLFGEKNKADVSSLWRKMAIKGDLRKRAPFFGHISNSIAEWQQLL